MREFFYMDGHGPYVWTAYGITLAVLLWNVWSARAALNRQLRDAARAPAEAEPTPRATVSQVRDD